jgi:hypothetical protein
MRPMSAGYLAMAEIKYRPFQGAGRDNPHHHGHGALLISLLVPIALLALSSWILVRAIRRGNPAPSGDGWGPVTIHEDRVRLPEWAGRIVVTLCSLSTVWVMWSVVDYRRGHRPDVVLTILFVLIHLFVLIIFLAAAALYFVFWQRHKDTPGYARPGRHH